MNEAKNPGQVSAYLDEWTLAQVQAYAKAEDRSVSWVVSFALKQFFVARQAGKPATRQFDLEEAIAAAVERGPVTTAEKQAGHRKNLAARAARMAARHK
jgi:predicted transcriptional regulator